MDPLLVQLLSCVFLVVSIAFIAVGSPKGVKIKRKLGLLKDENEEAPEPSMWHLVQKLPPSFHAFANSEEKYRRLSALSLLFFVFVIGYPLWHHTTRTYRAEFATFPRNWSVPMSVSIRLAGVDAVSASAVESLSPALLDRLRGGDVKPPLRIEWTVDRLGVRSLSALPPAPSTGVTVSVVVVPAQLWTHFSATGVRLGQGEWIEVQQCEDADKLLSRVYSAVWEVVVDVPHLNSIVSRDSRERMPPWQIATLPLSHQKRLVWDSAALSSEYAVQVVWLHENGRRRESERTGEEAAEQLDGARLSQREAERVTMGRIRRMGEMVDTVTRMEISSEHLWDFELSRFLEKDVQDRWTLTEEKQQEMIKEIDSRLSTSVHSMPMLKLVVLAGQQNVVLLDKHGEDQRGAAVAGWGAIATSGNKDDDSTDSQLLAAIRVLLGVDGDLPAGWTRAPVPLCGWELSRLRVRAALDNALRAAAAVRALANIANDIDNVVIGDDVAGMANAAVADVWAGLSTLDLPLLQRARTQADAALSHPSLLSLLYFPSDQKAAVYLPIMVPIVLPMFASIVSLIEWLVGWALSGRERRVRDWTSKAVVAVGVAMGVARVMYK